MKGAPFGPRWLRAQLAQLLPGFPDIAVCVAYSGGVDSTALLAALARAARSRLRVRALHVNHGLHPDARAWSLHCQEFAQRLGVPLKVIAVHVARTRGASLEEQARDARYAALARELQAQEVLLTAQHADDQLETVLLQLLRGAGLAGIAAMPPLMRFAAGFLARPLLRRSRAELAAWAQQQGLSWLEDESNADTRRDRNYLRHEVLPRIRSRWPACAASIARSARHAAQAQQFLQALGRADAERAADGEALSVTALRRLPAPRRANALRAWIGAAGWPAPDTRRLEELAQAVVNARADANPRVAWGGVLARRHADRLALQARATSAPPVPLTWAWRSAPELALPADLGVLALEDDARGPIDLDRLPDDIAVRWRCGGERLRPRGGGPRRALKTLLQEARIAPAERARLPLLFAGTRLLAVADRWSDASIHAQPRAAHRARIRWRRG